MFLINPYILQASGNPLWNGLQAYYTADNTPNDALGTYNGTLVNGATYGTGIINQGFSLDGVNDYVSVGNLLNFDGSTPFSLSCWFNPNNVSGFKPLISNMIGSPTYQGIELQISSNVLRVFLNNTSGTNSIRFSGSTTFTPSAWYHAVFTYDGSKDISGCNLYFNSSLETKTSTVNNLTGSIYSGSNTYLGTGQNFTLYNSGLLDEVGIWNRVLTSTEATELYNSGAAKQYPN